MRRLVLSLMSLFSLMMMPPASAQDMAPDPVDAEAVRLLLKRAMGAMLEKDARAFVTCCDDYVHCFFYDGTLIRGKKTIARALGDYFAQRPEGATVKLDVIPRSYRVLSPDIMMVDWPATIQGPEGRLTVNTLTTVRKVEGKWSITCFLESVPYTPLSKASSRLPDRE